MEIKIGDIFQDKSGKLYEINDVNENFYILERFKSKRDPLKPLTDYESEEFDAAFKDNGNEIFTECKNTSNTTNPILEPMVSRMIRCDLKYIEENLTSYIL